MSYFRSRLRAGSRGRTYLALTAASAALLGLAAPGAGAKPFAFEPIDFLRIPLPAGVTAPAQVPSFTSDGKHLLFAGKHTGDKKVGLWISDLKGGKNVRCITCAGPDVPDVNYVFPFRDGKRVFVGFKGVIECAPSVVN